MAHFFRLQELSSYCGCFAEELASTLGTYDALVTSEDDHLKFISKAYIER